MVLTTPIIWVSLFSLHDYLGFPLQLAWVFHYTHLVLILCKLSKLPLGLWIGWAWMAMIAISRAANPANYCLRRLKSCEPSESNTPHLRRPRGEGVPHGRRLRRAFRRRKILFLASPNVRYTTRPASNKQRNPHAAVVRSLEL